ncbi:MAG: HEAT repeat domain-containing protein [Bryobacteraceae bacterium]
MLRSSPSSAATADQLRKALRDRNNFLASKAAALAGELGLRDLIPDLETAFDRFMVNPAKSDPQCWAKNAIARTLKALEHDDPSVFIRGCKHIQLEPVWGGRADAAATLRATCALALAACSIDRAEILRHLVDLLVDPETPVRVDAARAIAQLPGWDSALLLRLKTLAGDREPEVIGQCFTSLLEISPKDSLALVAGFLDQPDVDLRLEAIAALGPCREPEAMKILKAYWERQPDPIVKRAILLSVGASTEQEAAAFLISVVDEGCLEHALISITALASSRFREQVRSAVSEIVKRRADPKLDAAFAKDYL